MSNVPEGAQLSDDGQYWWDGENWQLVEGAAGAGETAESESGGTESAEVTADDLTPVNDTGVEPGDENLIDEKLKPYFEPDYDGIEDDYSYAEQDAVMDDSQATGGGNSNENESNENESTDNQEGN